MYVLYLSLLPSVYSGTRITKKKGLQNYFLSPNKDEIDKYHLIYREAYGKLVEETIFLGGNFFSWELSNLDLVQQSAWS
jgi:hypothetical protein